VQSFHLLPITEAMIAHALTFAGPDFEDDVQIACAQAADIIAIVTRNVTAFSHSPVVAMASKDVPGRFLLPS
jgi:hypothetical protein